MLDNEPQPTDNSIDPSLPKPPAGRRSRRRPAGPPAPVVETLVVEAPSPAPVEEEPAEAVLEEAVVADEPGVVESAISTEAAWEESDELEEIEAAAEHADVAAAGQPDDDADAEPGESAELGDQGDGSSRRRRRRRGGRRRHTAGDGQFEQTADEADQDDTEGETAEAAVTVPRSEKPITRRDRDDAAAAEESGGADAFSDEEEDENAGGEAGSSGASRRRRRRRRRRGEDASIGAEDDPTEVVVKVREIQSSGDQIQGVVGSTRLEAKRQRRREGRDAGRRRAPIVSESEFLTRRESVKRQMVLRQSDEFSQIAVLEDGVLVEHYVDRESSSSLIGNIYLGRVQNVLPSMEAAFIDIGRGRNAVLYAGEVDWDANGSGHSERKIEYVLKSGQQILVQVTKDPVGAKGARLTNHVSIPGRYVVYAPGGHLSGISRKLPDVERKRLKHILADLIEEGASVIVRTAAEGASQDQLVRDVTRLKAQWEAIDKKTKQGGAPQQLYSEPDLTIRTVRDLFTEDFAELIIDGHGGDGDAYEMLADYLEHVAPHLRERVSHWDREAKGDVFSHYRLDEQIAKALERKVHLPSGGSLIIDRTEAMTVIDVNTGKFTGHGGNLEATVTANNLEAAEEVIRQLRLRDIGGIIVIDFIDMVLPSNRELLLRRMVECLGRDRTRHQVSEVTSLGLVQMTRKKIGTGLAEAFTEPCECCNQRGYLVHDMPVATQAPSDGGDRQGRNNRKRTRGKSSSVTPQSTPSGDGQQSQTQADEDKDLLTDEARAAAQAAIIAVAHAGAKTRTETDSFELLDDLVASLQEGDAGERSPEDAGALEGTEGAVEQVAPAEAAPSRSRRSSRTRSRRSASAQAAVPEVDTTADLEAPITEDVAGEPEADVPATVTKRAPRKASTRATAKKTAAKRSTTRKAAAAAPVESSVTPDGESVSATSEQAPAESRAAEEPVVTDVAAEEPVELAPAEPEATHPMESEAAVDVVEVQFEATDDADAEPQPDSETWDEPSV